MSATKQAALDRILEAQPENRRQLVARLCGGLTWAAVAEAEANAEEGRGVVVPGLSSRDRAAVLGALVGAVMRDPQVVAERAESLARHAAELAARQAAEKAALIEKLMATKPVVMDDDLWYRLPAEGNYHHGMPHRIVEESGEGGDDIDDSSGWTSRWLCIRVADAWPDAPETPLSAALRKCREIKARRDTAEAEARRLGTAKYGDRKSPEYQAWRKAENAATIAAIEYGDAKLEAAQLA
jgi:hypothetical protein